MHNTNTPQKPADLDPTKLHTPAEVDAWHAKWADYRDALRAQEQRQLQAEAAKKAHENRILTREEYHQQAVKREAERKAKEAAREAERKAEADAKAAYLASMPEMVEVLERSEYTFLLQLQHWFALGYTAGENSIEHWLPGIYSVKLHKPATRRASK